MAIQRDKNSYKSYFYYIKATIMSRFTLIYGKEKKLGLGKILEHPEIMTQGEILEEFEENIKDAYRLMVMEDAPKDY